MTNKEKQKCRDAYESYTRKKVGLKTIPEYTGWLFCWEYHLQTKKKDMDEMIDELYNDIEQEKFMKEKGGLKNE